LRKQTQNKGTADKQLLLVCLVFLCLSSLLFSRFAEAGNERWKAIAGKTGDDSILYDPGSVIPSGPRTFRV